MKEQQPERIRTPHVEIRRHSRRNGADTIGRHHHTICRETGKIRYRDSHQAAQALEGARRQRAGHQAHLGESSRRERRSFRCEFCNGGFHLTSEDRRLRGMRAAHDDEVKGGIVVALSTDAQDRRRRLAMTVIAAACAL